MSFFWDLNFKFSNFNQILNKFWSFLKSFLNNLKSEHTIEWKWGQSSKEISFKTEKAILKKKKIIISYYIQINS